MEANKFTKYTKEQLLQEYEMFNDLIQVTESAGEMLTITQDCVKIYAELHRRKEI
jgi:hypothetical protein